MCVNCVNNVEVVLGKIVLAAAIAKDPAHRLLSRAGLVGEPDPVRHDVTTVAFLRSLDLDPVAVLGPEAVAAAEQWTPRPQPAGLLGVLGVSGALGRRSRLPMGSQSLANAQ